MSVCSLWRDRVANVLGFVRHRYKLNTYGVRVLTLKFLIEKYPNLIDANRLKKVVPDYINYKTWFDCGIDNNFAHEQMASGVYGGVYPNTDPLEEHIGLKGLNWEHAVYFNKDKIEMDSYFIFQKIFKEDVKVQIDEYKWDYPFRILIVGSGVSLLLYGIYRITHIS